MKLHSYLFVLIFSVSTSAMAIETNTTTVAPTTSTDTSANTTALNSAQTQNEAAVIATIIAIDKNEIAAAKEVLKRKVGPLVRKYALLMLNQHNQNLRDVTRLSKNINIQPDTSAATTIQDQGQNLLTQLKSVDNKALGKSYIDAMITGHTDLLNKITDDISKVQNPKLKKFLENTAKTVQAHLNKAKEIQAKQATLQ